MATRASFWIGDPRNIVAREWLGCKAFDGYPDNPALEKIVSARDDGAFRNAVDEIKSDNDFAHPGRGWPYPWDGSIFVTDFTYAFFDGVTWISCFDYGFLSMEELRSGQDWPDDKNPSMMGIPAPEKYSRNQPDSIMFIDAIS